MPQLIEVSFKGNRKEFFLWDADEAPAVEAPVVVDADRGEDLGFVHALGELASRRSAGAAHGLGTAEPSKKARRLGTSDDVRRLDEVRAQDDDARRKAMERVKANQLQMKVSDAEWQWDRKKLTFYFTAEKRVDFRNLVRELAAMFRTRIELKQIGVRDEAKRLDGIGRCGRQYCSSSWLPELRPVNLGVAKDQRLSLNPSQISGACGRLMCCLRYEHDFYVQQRKRFPKEGRLLKTARGDEKVVSNDIFRERVTLRGADGETRVIALLDLKRETDGDADVVAPLAALAVDDAETTLTLEEETELVPSEEVLAMVRTSEIAVVVNGNDVLVGDAGDGENEEGEAAEEAGGEGPADPSARKPHRRRGRRGGRRNRAGRDRGQGGGEGAGPPVGGN